MPRCKTMTATSTATVLMIQLCRKRRSFLEPGCMMWLKTTTASCSSPAGKTRRDFGGFAAAFPPDFPPGMKTIFSAILLAATLTVFADGVVAPGAKLEKLSGGFAFTEGATRDRAGNVFFCGPAERPHHGVEHGRKALHFSPAVRLCERHVL